MLTWRAAHGDEIGAGASASEDGRVLNDHGGRGVIVVRHRAAEAHVAQAVVLVLTLNLNAVARCFLARRLHAADRARNSMKQNQTKQRKKNKINRRHPS